MDRQPQLFGATAHRAPAASGVSRAAKQTLLRRALALAVVSLAILPWLEARATAAADPVAVAYTPRIVQDTDDGFPPVSWFVVRSLSFNGDQTRLCIAGACGARIAGRALPPNEGFAEYLRYPAGANTTDEHSSYANAIAGTPSLAPPVVYYYRAPRSPDNSFVIRYWIFYSFNWFNANGSCGSCRGLSHDLHEGDWEHIDIRFSSADKPLRVRLSQHKSYTPLSWNGAGLQKDGTHLITYTARGDHANYPHTGAWPLTAPEIGQIAFSALNGFRAARDYIGVRHDTVRYSPTADHVGNLAAPSALANYSCWGGRMGQQIGPDGLLAGSWGTSPGSPLAQSRDLPGVNATCAGTARSAAAVPSSSQPEPQPQAAGLFPPTAPVQDDDSLSTCAGWLGSPVAIGEARIVACDQSELTRHFATGAPDDTQFSVSLSGDPGDLSIDPGPPTVGLLSTSQLSQVTLEAHSDAVSTIGLQMADADGNTSAATFNDVALSAGQQLHLTPGAAGVWNLVDTAGQVIASVLSQLIPTAGTP